MTPPADPAQPAPYVPASVRWHLSHSQDVRAREIADRHYSRGTPGSLRFVPPGACAVFWMPGAYWVTLVQRPEYVKHAWPRAWMCSAFRNERGADQRSSELIVEALAASRAVLGEPPPEGIITFVDTRKVRRKRDPGRCFLKAGFRPVGLTQDLGLLVLHLGPEAFPAPLAPFGFQPSFAMSA